MAAIFLADVNTARTVVFAATALSVALAIGLGMSRVGVALAAGLPLGALIGFQGFRLLLDALMRQTYSASLLPPALTYAGHTVDFVFGFLSIALAVFAGVRGLAPLVLRVWNVLGIVLLLNLVWLSLANAWSGLSALIWIPSVMLPLALLCHVVVARRMQLPAAAGFNGR
jgi:hypothetical protein